MVPIYTVERAVFKSMLKALDARYELPSRNYFRDVVLPRLYNNTRDKVKAELANVPFFSATTDMWSSRTTEPYLSLTVHFVADDWRLVHRCLQTSFFPSDHTGEEIANELKGI